mmetsp:Transcript_24633/g.24233  ORF Transcript_24633/g.24233 Transcript_24633/m.24233 type:complete len:113 (-) Transcript_24633:128-466(-)|eukprot:CAMPEP_0170556460 /NCGR_PEP_ID=MMETSP0211-20121228/16944_1 /TAXON_ID=311385 /ORGANISM="Pseudokeronopsis sp., Strain OXSARD2" /LENGTH=112 /DNA_ID=CAMNT_0010866807 /DNA_START=18 /DNA_END=356 /DNA_ORIENTATION=+
MDKSRLIDDTILVTHINKDGKFFEKVSRISAVCQVSKIEIELDVNTEIYPMEENVCYAMAIVSSLNQDGSEDFDVFTYINEGTGGGLSSLLDEYQYVVHGKIFKQNIEKEKI